MLRPTLRLAAVAAAAFAILVPPAHAGTKSQVTLEVAPLDGGQRTLLGRASRASNGITQVDWTRDGTSVLAMVEKPVGRRGVEPVLRRHPLGGGPVADLQAQRAAFEMSFGPDGATVAETYDGGDVVPGGLGGVVLRDVASGAIRARLPQSAEGDDLYEGTPTVCWSADGSRAAIVAQERRGLTLRSVEVATGRLIRRVDLRRASLLDCPSPDGRRVLLEREDRTNAVEVLDLDTGGRTRMPLRGRDDVDQAQWSPDGARIAFVDDSGIAVVDPAIGWGPSSPWATGAVPGEEAEIRALRWSPDGRHLAYVESSYDGPGERAALAVMSMDPPAPPRVLVQPKRAGLGPYAWSPDGTRIAFATLHFDFGRSLANPTLGG